MVSREAALRPLQSGALAHKVAVTSSVNQVRAERWLATHVLADRDELVKDIARLTHTEMSAARLPPGVEHVPQAGLVVWHTAGLADQLRDFSELGQVRVRDVHLELDSS